jgi:hypothetical protein
MDHVMPWQKLGIANQPLELPIPLNHPANFMPLSKSLNSQRKNTPWSDYFSNLKGPDKNQVGKDLLISPEECNSETRENLDAFATFLLKRWVIFIDRALNNVGLEEFTNMNKSQKCSTLADHISELCRLLESINVKCNLPDLKEFINESIE